MMTRLARRVLAVALCIPLAVGVCGCGQDDVATTGTNTLTVEVVNLVGAQGSDLSAELSKNVDYGQQAPVWTLPATPVTGSPFAHSETLTQLPEGEFDLTVRAGSDQKTQAAAVKGQACEMSLVMGKDETVTITIDGLNEFGDKGYGDCAATITR